MDNMKPRDFVLSRQPLLDLDAEQADRVRALIGAGDILSRALIAAMATVLGAEKSDATVLDTVREAFFLETQAAFDAYLLTIQAGSDPGEGWLADLRRTALRLFEARALPGLADSDFGRVEKVLMARRNLLGAFAGRTKAGRDAYAVLRLEVPAKRKEQVPA